MDIAGAIIRGLQAGQAIRDHQQAEEDSKLRRMMLKHQLSTLDIEDKLRVKDLQDKQAQAMYDSQQGQPASSFPRISDETIPSTGLLPPGTTSMPGSLSPPDSSPQPAFSMPAPSSPAEAAPRLPQPIAFPGLPAEIAGGTTGYTKTPLTAEQMLALQRRAAIEKAMSTPQKLGEGETFGFPGQPPLMSGGVKPLVLQQNATAIDPHAPPGTPPIAVGKPSEPTTEFGVFKQTYTRGLGAKSFDDLTTAQQAGLQPAFNKAKQDPMAVAQIAALRAQELLAKQQANAITQPAPAGVTGDEAIKAYTPDQQRVIKLIANYKLPLPSGFALRSPYWQTVLSGAAAYDPSFDASQYPVRLKTRQSFSNGPEAAAINSLNTAVGHLDTLSKRADELSNFGAGVPGTTTANWLKNVIKTSAGSPDVKNFMTARDAVASELTKVFRGSGGSEADVRGWQQNIDSAGSPEQLKGAITQAIDLMGSRLQALQSQYEKGVGKPADFKFLTPKSEQILQRLSDGQPTTTGGGAPASAIPAPVQQLLQGATAGRHTLSDGSVWLKNTDGSIQRVQ